MHWPSMHDGTGASLGNQICLTPPLEIVLWHSAAVCCKCHCILVELGECRVDTAESGEMIDRDLRGSGGQVAHEALTHDLKLHGLDELAEDVDGPPGLSNASFDTNLPQVCDELFCDIRG